MAGPFIPDRTKLMEEVEYNPSSGEFTYTQKKTVSRKHLFHMVVPKAPKVSHDIGDRADKVYGEKFVGVYVFGKAIMAAKCAVLIMDGEWPQAIKFKDGNWKNMKYDNLEATTRSAMARGAALSKASKTNRRLPTYIYPTSDGRYIGKRQTLSTEKYDTPDEALMALQNLMENNNEES